MLLGLCAKTCSAQTRDLISTSSATKAVLRFQGSSTRASGSDIESVGRYWRHVFSAHKSTVFLRVLEPVLLMSAVATLVAAWNTFMTTAYALPALHIVPLAHQLTGGVVSLGLVFHTNVRKQARN